MRHILNVLLAAVACIIATGNAHAAEKAGIEFDVSQLGEIVIRIGGVPVASYIYQDSQIPRPYFAHVRTLNGIQVTRNHPPIAGHDVDDHPDFHPGIWMAFGDISGSDYWRNKASVEHVEFTAAPRGGKQRGSFAVKYRYRNQNRSAAIVCEEVVRYTIITQSAGWLLLWDSNFSSDKPFYFGDQEEMGLGVRVATEIRVDTAKQPDITPGNGTMVDAAGRKNGDEIWGNAAAWCDYSGVIDGMHVGLTIFCHPKNFRPSWFHARDYGLLEANPFGRQAFGKGDTSQVIVSPGDSLRLRYGVFVHSGADSDQLNLPEAHRQYIEESADQENDQGDR